MLQTKEWNTQIFQVVCVVYHLEEALKNWKTMVEFNVDSIRMGQSDDKVQCIYRGKKIQCSFQYATFDLGGVQMRLVEPLNQEGGDPYADKLKKCGQGFHHIGFYAEEYGGLLALYEAKGLTPVYEERLDGVTYRLYDFESKIGMMAAPWEAMVGPCART